MAVWVLLASFAPSTRAAPLDCRCPYCRLAGKDLGVDDLAMSEHVVMAHRPEKYGPGSAPHRFDEPWPEPLTTLAAMAAVTRRVRVISTIVIAPLRPAVLLAKTAAQRFPTALESGRFVIDGRTSSPAWHEEEYAALGVPFAEASVAGAARRHHWAPAERCL